MLEQFFTIPTGCSTNLALIVAPYFDTWFATKIAKSLKPKRLRFLLDDSASDDELEKLKEQLRESGIQDSKIAFGRASGLVHIKAYYFEFQNSSSEINKQFYFGSANATRAGFSGKINAELVAHVAMLPERHKRIIRYFSDLTEAVEKQHGVVHEAVVAPTFETPALRLPSFQVVAAKPKLPSSFDSWLQRGRLAAKYRNPQRFLIVSAPLKKAFQPGPVQRVFEDQGLTTPGKNNEVRHRYIALGGVDKISGDQPSDGLSKEERNWKSKYCVWTHLGEWISEECYIDKKNELVANAKASREAAINTLLKNDKEFRADRKSEFLERLKKVWEELSKNDDAQSYLHNTSGELDQDFYGDIFERKFTEDLRLANDERFRDRFISGWEFSPVPKFRSDVNNWESFVSSWCESISVETDKKSTQSLLAKQLLYIFPSEVNKPMDLSAALARHWRLDAVEIGSVVDAIYPYDKCFYPAKILSLNPPQFEIYWVDGTGKETVLGTQIRGIGQSVREYYVA